MRRSILSLGFTPLVFIVGWCLGSQEETPQEKSPEEKSWPEGIIARVGDREISEASYREWLFDAHGWSHIHDFLTLSALRVRAAQLGITVTSDDIAGALEESWQDHVVTRFRGREELYLESLKTAGLDRKGELRRRAATIERDLLTRAISVKTIEPTEDSIQTFHAELFSKDSQRVHIRVAFFDRFRDIKEGDTHLAEKMESMKQNALERATQFKKRLDSGESFQALVSTEADPTLVPKRDGWMQDLRFSGGELEYYVPTHFRGALEESIKVSGLSSFTGPVESSQGYFVFELLKREPAPLETVREEVIKRFFERLPTPQEIHATRERVREQTPMSTSPGFP